MKMVNGKGEKTSLHQCELNGHQTLGKTRNRMINNPPPVWDAHCVPHIKSVKSVKSGSKGMKYKGKLDIRDF
jgi:hypothetical protein